MLGMGLGLTLGNNVAAVSGGGGGAFTPLSLTGIDLWLDDDATTKYVDAGVTPVSAFNQPVQRWADKSPAGRYVRNPTAGTQPLHHAAGLYFDGVDDTMITETTDVAWTDGSGQQVLSMTIKPDDVTATKVPVDISDASNVLRAYLAFDFNGKPEPTVWTTDAVGHSFTAASALSAGVEYVYTIVVTTSQMQAYINGSSIGTVAIGSALRTDLSRLTLAFLHAFVGHIRKVVHVSGTISAPDLASLNTFMAT